MLKDIYKLNKEELIELIGELFREREMLRQNKINKVQVGEVIVESNNAELNDCRKVIDDIIHKHQNLLTTRQDKIRSDNLMKGYLG
jgi:hypothetical protein